MMCTHNFFSFLKQVNISGPKSSISLFEKSLWNESRKSWLNFWFYCIQQVRNKDDEVKFQNITLAVWFIFAQRCSTLFNGGRWGGGSVFGRQFALQKYLVFNLIFLIYNIAIAKEKNEKCIIIQYNVLTKREAMMILTIDKLAGKCIYKRQKYNYI